jgi:hypothetical protein
MLKSVCLSHSHTNTHTQTHMHTNTHRAIARSASIMGKTRKGTMLHAGVCECVHVWVHVLYACMHARVCVCVYLMYHVYMHTHTHRQHSSRGRQADWPEEHQTRYAHTRAYIRARIVFTPVHTYTHIFCLYHCNSSSLFAILVLEIVRRLQTIDLDDAGGVIPHQRLTQHARLREWLQGHGWDDYQRCRDSYEGDLHRWV